ncbi:MAG: PKD domain-containing protein, partial [Bacteroidales bacterium]
LPVQKQSLISNTKDIFHLGIINGNETGGCRFGYFSDFNVIKINAMAVKTQTPITRVCYGERVRLEAWGGNNFHWTPQDFLDDPYSQFPTAYPRGFMEYTVSVSGVCDMVGTAKVTVQVAPKVEALFTLDTVQACAPYNFVITNKSIGVTDRYKWDFGDGSPFLFFDSTVPPPITLNKTYRNTSDTIKKYQITLIVNNKEACWDTLKRSVMLYPEINADFSTDKTIGCHPLMVQYADKSTGANGNRPFLWEFGDGASSALQNPSHVFNNFGDNDTVFTSRFVVQNQYRCSDTAYKQITVHPYITADYSFKPEQACNPYNMRISNQSVGVDTYKWNFGDGTTSGISDTAFNKLYNNTTTSSKTYPITLVALNKEGCSDTLKKSVVVHPNLSASFTVSSNKVCDSTIVTFTNTSVGASIYSWSFGDGAGSNEKNPKHLYRNLGTKDTVYRVRLISTASNLLCVDTFEINITVHPFIKADFSIPTSIQCNPANITISNNSVGVDTYKWDFGDGQTADSSSKSFVHQFINVDSTTQVFNISLTASNNQGCTKTLQKQLTVYPTLLASFSQSRPKGCDSVKIEFTNASQGAAQFRWDFGDGASSFEKNVSHIYRNFGTADVTYTVRLIAIADNLLCRDTTYSTVTVHPYIKANYSFIPQAGCSPFDITINNTSVGVTTYNWNFGDATTSDTSASSFVKRYINSTATVQNRNLRLIVRNNQGCTDTLIRQVRIYPKVTANFTAISGCHPHTITNFNNTSTNATIFNWSFGDGGSSTLKNPSYTFNNFSNTIDRTFKITLVASSQYECSDTKDTTITVFHKPLASFDPGPLQGCSPYTMIFTNKAVGYDSIVWNFGNGDPISNSKAATVTTTYVNNTNNVLNPTVTQTVFTNNGCTNTTSTILQVYPRITANFEAYSGCAPLTISNFNNTSLGVQSQTWDFGDGTQSSIKNPSHTFQNFSSTTDKTYTIKLTNVSFTGCTVSKDTTITVFAKPDASFNVSAAQGCSPYIVTINNSSTGVQTYDWDFGDNTPRSNSSAATLTHQYFNATNNIINFPITLIASTNNGCKDTLVQYAQVYPDIKAQFTINSGCTPLNSNIVNTSVGASKYDWDFGDGTKSTLQHPQKIYQNFSHTRDTTFKVRLIATSINNCTDTLERYVTVNYAPLADFTIQNETGCAPHNVTYIRNTIGATSVLWNFSDSTPPSNSMQTPITRTYQNSTGKTYSPPVTLIAYAPNGCSDTLVKNIQIYSEVIARFDAFSGCHPHTISTFNNTTIGADYYNWTYGDGLFSTKKDEAHTFNNFSNTDSVQFTIKLVARSHFECKDSISKTISVYHKPLPMFTIANNTGCAPLTVNFNNTSVGHQTLTWNWGDTTGTLTTNATSVSHLYKNQYGKTIDYPITLTAVSKQGCTATKTDNVKIHSQVITGFTANSGCHPHTIPTFNNITQNAHFYLWNYGDGLQSSKRDEAHTFTNTSNTDSVQYTIELKAWSNEGCRDSSKKTISVYNVPSPAFELLNNIGCAPITVTLKNNTAGVDSFIWNFGDNTPLLYDNSKIITHQYVNQSNETIKFPITLQAFTKLGCSSKASDTAIVHSQVIVNFSAFSGCSPHRIANFKNTTQNADNYRWNFGDNTTSTNKNPTKTFTNLSNTTPQNFTIELKAWSKEGCRDSLDTTITVYHKPKADFTILDNEACAPFEASFTNISIGVDSLIWNFGDKTPKSNQKTSPVLHTYQNVTNNTITFPVVLTTYTNQGCVDSVSYPVKVHSQVITGFTAYSGCHPHTINSFNNTTKNADFYRWDYGDGLTSTKKDTAHVFYNYSTTLPITRKIELKAWSIEGCRDSIDTTITIFNKPLAKFTFNKNENCAPFPVTINNLSEGADSLVWNYGDSPVDTITSNSKLYHTYQNVSGKTVIYPVKLFVANNHGCTNTWQDTVKVHSQVLASFSAYSGCHPHTINSFNNTTLNAHNFIWNYGDGLSSNKRDTAHTFNNFSKTTPKTFTIELKAWSNQGCRDSLDTTITVFNTPSPSFSITDNEGCAPWKVTIENNTIGYDSIVWDFGDTTALS